MRDLLLQPIASLFEFLVAAKNFSYNEQWISSVRLDRPVLSVGNLTVGGTGKTPIVLALLAELKQRGVKVGLVSRGYKSGVNGVTEVELDSSRYFGDEPTLVKAKYPEFPFFIGPDRALVGQRLIEAYPETQLIIADDGFQHRRLYRDLDVVLLDATRDRNHYELLPAGYAREPLSSLKRAGVIIFTKCDLNSSVRREEIRGWVKESGVALEDKMILDARFILKPPVHVVTGEVFSEAWNGAWKLISAIGNPGAFEKSVKAQLGFRISEHIQLPDHFRYSFESVRELLDRESVWLTTEKDAVKLKESLDPSYKVYATPMEFELIGEKERLLEKICRLAF